jgi:hypothetical protein
MEPDATGDPRAGQPPQMRSPDVSPLEMPPPDVSPPGSAPEIVPPDIPPGSAADVSPPEALPSGVSPPAVTPGDHPMSYWPAAPVVPPASRPGRWDGVSIAALVLAVPGVLVAAIPLAIAGLVRTRHRVRRGRGLAIAGLVLSWAWTILLSAVAGAALMLVAEREAPPAASSPGVATAPVAQPPPAPASTEPPRVTPSPTLVTPPRSVRPKRIRVKDIRVGHCIDRTPANTFETLPVVPCVQPHDVEVYAIRGLGRGGWPGDKALTDRADKACRPPFEAYVGVPYDESTLEISWYLPTQSSWRVGDREVTCILHDPAGRLVGTMKGRAL